ncbi:MAG: deoxyribodipyrimidine photo-lyase [Candidatus Velthaea sp.]
MASGRSVFAFTRDLRLGDHAGLAVAARHGGVVPVIVIDSTLSARLRRSPRRAAFYCEAVRSLDRSLRERGVRLIVRRGSPGTILRAIARAVGADTVAWTIAYDQRSVRAERDLQSTLEEAGIRVYPVHDAIVIPPEDSALANRRGDGYRAFVPYHARWRTLVPAAREPDAVFASVDIQSEPLPEPAEFGSQALLERLPSEAAAASALGAFLEGPALQYATGRNVPGADHTAHLSADLSFGTIAARTVVRAACERANDPFLLTEEQTSLRTFLRSLALRDFFLQLAWHTDGPDEAPLQEKMRDFRFARSHPQLEAWRTGRTGYPLVDAGIRELRATGWMHPRIRSIAASFLCFDLGVDWRVGRDEWDVWLIEDAPALATGNWQWIAGVGADLAAYPRIYNPIKQARRFDPAAAYIRAWIPELAMQPDQAILDPGGDASAQQLHFDLFGPRRYAAPIVDHGAAARAFLERYAREVRATPV